MFDLKEYLERVKTEVTDPILEYMQEAEIEDFTADDVARCGELLVEYLTALSELKEPEDADIMAQVEKVVLALNELNEGTMPSSRRWSARPSGSCSRPPPWTAACRMSPRM